MTPPPFLTVPAFAVNMSLGLTMTLDPTTGAALVSRGHFARRRLVYWSFFRPNGATDPVPSQACGPTIPKDCGSITTYNGACLQIDPMDGVGAPLPPSLDGA